MLSVYLLDQDGVWYTEKATQGNGSALLSKLVAIGSGVAVGSRERIQMEERARGRHIL